MKTLMIAMLLAITVAANSQVNMPIGGPPTEKTLVGNETWIVKSGEKRFRIITSNDSVAYWIRSRFERDWTIQDMNYSQNKDRKGKYWERSFYFLNEDWDKVIEYIKPKLSKL